MLAIFCLILAGVECAIKIEKIYQWQIKVQLHDRQENVSNTMLCPHGCYPITLLKLNNSVYMAIPMMDGANNERWQILNETHAAWDDGAILWMLDAAYVDFAEMVQWPFSRGNSSALLAILNSSQIKDEKIDVSISENETLVINFDDTLLKNYELLSEIENGTEATGNDEANSGMGPVVDSSCVIWKYVAISLACLIACMLLILVIALIAKRKTKKKEEGASEIQATCNLKSAKLACNEKNE